MSTVAEIVNALRVRVFRSFSAYIKTIASEHEASVVYSENGWGAAAGVFQIRGRQELRQILNEL